MTSSPTITALQIVLKCSRKTDTYSISSLHFIIAIFFSIVRYLLTRSNDLRNAKTRRTRVFAGGPGWPRWCSIGRPWPDVWRPRRDREEEPETHKTGQTDDWIAPLSGIEELQFSISFCQFLEIFNFNQKEENRRKSSSINERVTMTDLYAQAVL